MAVPVSTTPGQGGIRKQFQVLLPIASVTGLYPISPTLNNAISIAKITVSTAAQGSSATATYKMTSKVPGSASVDLTAIVDGTASYTANGYAFDLPCTTTALKNVAAGAMLVLSLVKGSGTEPPTLVTVEYFDSDGNQNT